MKKKEIKKLTEKQVIENLEKQQGKPRIVYGTNIKKCIELSHKYNEIFYKWHNPKFFN